MSDGEKPGLALRCAEGVIRAGCRMLPEEERAYREAEWCWEIEAIAGDPDIRWRAAEVLKYALHLLPHVRATRSASAAMAQRAALHRSFKRGLVSLDQVLTDAFKQGRVGGRVLGIASVALGAVVSLVGAGVGRVGVAGIVIGFLGTFLGGGSTVAILEELRKVLRREGDIEH
ncbi:hypothetical protein [Streptomyces sp. SID12488]|uniref:hypothetical protein n=1 Tax=Streptomyces sp. SID12488 TaxID=2706040 RepID=UPI0013DA6DDE|nr:hypothetical protein [Streptomyces sp. SID12488]NEA69027.1 hypothetical protein [Streptomyces sp. SID12488]